MWPVIRAAVALPGHRLLSRVLWSLQEKQMCADLFMLHRVPTLHPTLRPGHAPLLVLSELCCEGSSLLHGRTLPWSAWGARLPAPTAPTRNLPPCTLGQAAQNSGDTAGLWATLHLQLQSKSELANYSSQIHSHLLCVRTVLLEHSHMACQL